jgi:two-component system LytT family response regulator
MVMSRSLNSYETLLPARLFFRTHKSYIVNTRHISAINRANGITLLVGNQFTVPVARRRSGELLNFLQCS